MSVKKALRENFEELEKMSIPEYTLYRKFCEVNNKEWTTDEHARIWEIKNSLWCPEEPEDYLKLQPAVINVKNTADSKTWTLLRIFCSTMPWNQNVGRIMRFIVYDKVTRSYLGVMSLASDFISLGPRDSYIGWTYEHRIKKKRLNYTAMGSTIVPTQPLGFDYVGGKLMTLILCSDVIVNAWNNNYKKEKLVSITTTSLYGGQSQYNGLKYWKKCGSTEGKIPMEPTDEMYKIIKDWVKEKYPNDYKKLTVNEKKILSRPKSRMLSFAYTKFGIKPPENNAPRGVYVCNLYNNSSEFLSMKTDVLGKPLYDNKLQIMINLWKEKYAKKRIEKLVKDGSFSTKSLFYDKLIGMEWKEVKEKYLKDVKK